MFSRWMKLSFHRELFAGLESYLGWFEKTEISLRCRKGLKNEKRSLSFLWTVSLVVWIGRNVYGQFGHPSLPAIRGAAGLVVILIVFRWERRSCRKRISWIYWVQGLHKKHQGKAYFDRYFRRVAEIECILVIQANGAGKTTLGLFGRINWSQAVKYHPRLASGKFSD